jgi:hypothetical protein
MSSELEQQLEGLFQGPEPDPGAGEEALHRALRVLQPAEAPHRGFRAAVLAFAAVVVLLVISAGALAAAGALHVSFGAKAKPRPAAVQLTLPPGANGVAAIVDGRLSVVTKGGFQVQGLPVSAAALSPHARYVAAGVGHSLVALRPDGSQAWSHSTSGQVVDIAWAPDGLRIAYIVRTGRRFVLHTIYGNGIHDTTIDRSVRAVRPSWRADNLAFAYVGGGGRAVVYDVGHESRQVLAAAQPVAGVAFAPAGDALALQGPKGVSLVENSRDRHVAGAAVEAFGWLNGRLAVAVPGLDSAVIHLFAPNGAPRGSSQEHGIVKAITPRLAVVQRGRTLVAGHTLLLTVPPRATVRGLEIG